MPPSHGRRWSIFFPARMQNFRQVQPRSNCSQLRTASTIKSVSKAVFQPTGSHRNVMLGVSIVFQDPIFPTSCNNRPRPANQPASSFALASSHFVSIPACLPRKVQAYRRKRKAVPTFCGSSPKTHRHGWVAMGIQSIRVRRPTLILWLNVAFAFRVPMFQPQCAPRAVQR